MSTIHGSLKAQPSAALSLGLQAWGDSRIAPPSDFMLTRVYAVGMPAERRARIAARRAFVRVKRRAVEATEAIEGSLGDLLRRKVRQTDEIGELAELREVILALMPDTTPEQRVLRLHVRREFEQAFGEFTTTLDLEAR